MGLEVLRMNAIILIFLDTHLVYSAKQETHNGFLRISTLEMQHSFC